MGSPRGKMGGCIFKGDNYMEGDIPWQVFWHQAERLEGRRKWTQPHPSGYCLALKIPQPIVMPGIEYSIFLLPNDVFPTEESEHPEGLKGGVPSSGRGRRCSRATYVARFRGRLTCFLAVGKQKNSMEGRARWTAERKSQQQTVGYPHRGILSSLKKE